MKIVIVGANFGNKGAQSMLFTTVSEIRRRCPDAENFFAHAQNFPVLNDNFTFTEIYFRRNLVDVQTGGIKLHNVDSARAEETLAAIQNADLIIDISGFALGDNGARKVRGAT